MKALDRSPQKVEEIIIHTIPPSTFKDAVASFSGGFGFCHFEERQRGKTLTIQAWEDLALHSNQ